MRVRVILQTGTLKLRGILFDDDGVRSITVQNAEDYADHKPCCLLVSADGENTYPLQDLGFCTAKIVVTSPNLMSKSRLKGWEKQAQAERFVATPPSCLEVVYLL